MTEIAIERPEIRHEDASPAKRARKRGNGSAGAGEKGDLTFPKVTPDAIRHAFETGEYPYKKKMGRKEYEAEKARLQAELLKVQLWTQETGQKFVLIFEGRDAAGKGGTIKRFMEHLNPRSARVVALNKPTDEE
ncbi:MAG: polyphosphate kinase 2, partial [Alphaproteobacteria bacterium]